MSLGSILSFEGFNLKKIGKLVKKNPERLLLGALDPASSKAWGKVLGKDYEPAVDQMGGPTGKTFDEAKAAGIDTGASQTTHGIAHVVAAVIAGGYGAGQLGGAAGAGAGVGEGVGGGLAEGVGGGLAEGVGGGLAEGAGGVGAVGSAGAAGGGLSSADAAALYGEAGYGGGMSGAETSAFDSGVGSKLSLGNYQRLMQLMPKQQQQQQQRRLEDVRYDNPDIGAYLREATVQPSSRTLKSPRSRGLSDALGRGLSGEDPIDANGVEVVAIKALDKRIANLLDRANALAQRKTGAAS